MDPPTLKKNLDANDTRMLHIFRELAELIKTNLPNKIPYETNDREGKEVQI